jgi:hypothetical protein
MMERRRRCIEALKQLAGTNDTNRDQVVRMHVMECIKPEAADLRKQLQGLAEDIDAEAGTATGEDWITPGYLCKACFTTWTQKWWIRQKQKRAERHLTSNTAK